MSQGPEFKYDVAFSFLGLDERLAVQIRDLLEQRVRTFIYSDAERQATLAGRDGADAFSRVFGREARLVVVLYRNGWGEDGFTAVEATAIRNRAYETGYEFTFFIPLDAPPEVPPWLPRTRLWHGLTRWGVEGAAAAVESRIEEIGGTPRQESIEEVATRIRRERRQAADRGAFLESSEGVTAARQEFDRLCGELGRAASQTGGMVVKRGPEGGVGAMLLAGDRRLTFVFEPAYINALKGSELRVVEWDGRTSRQRFPQIQSPGLNTTTEYDFDLIAEGQRGWRRHNGNAGDFLQTTQFADSLVKYLLERIGDDSQGRT